MVALQDGKQHPTQKSIHLMEWCIEQIPQTARMILDPFMGSGTTGLAAVRQGRKFIGVELDATYFDVACRRIEKFYREDNLLHPAASEHFHRRGKKSTDADIWQ